MNANPGRMQPRTPLEKFDHPSVTAKGETRAWVDFDGFETLWFNTGTLCNIECVNCYIESSPKNDRLVYLTAAEVAAFLDEIDSQGKGPIEIGFTGGEPFMNPDMLTMLEDTLARGHHVLVLTNAMQPMQRPSIQKGLLALRDSYHDRLVLRVSLDHHSKALHETERGPNTWDKALDGLDWLSENGFQIAIAGRTCWDEDEQAERNGYADLIATRGWTIDPADRTRLVLLPEMEGNADVPEITTACWDILNVAPGSMMCATSRMIVKRKGQKKPTVLPCTLIAYDDRFDMGSTLAEAESANGGMFDDGSVKLCHVNCAKFCVLGGGSCSG